MALLSLLDLVTRQYNDVLTGLVEDVTLFTPEFSEIPVVTRPGITYKVLSRTAVPTPGFRWANAGATPAKSVYKQSLKEMYFLDCPIIVDEMVRKGDDGTAGDLLAQEAQGVLQGAMITLGSQFYYGTDSDSKGFQGLRSQLSALVSVSAANTTSSVYAVWLNPQGVCFDVGKDGQISMPPFQRYPIVDPNDSTKLFFGWASNLSCYVGLSVKSAWSVYAAVGIADSWTNVTTNTFFTDQVAAKVVEKVPLTRRNGLKWFMNRRSIRMLQYSRAALGYQPAGASSAGPAWSPKPTESEGYPIVVTDSITNSENNT